MVLGLSLFLTRTAHEDLRSSTRLFRSTVISGLEIYSTCPLRISCGHRRTNHCLQHLADYEPRFALSWWTATSLNVPFFFSVFWSPEILSITVNAAVSEMNTNVGK